jgi:hypothetical protein
MRVVTLLGCLLGWSAATSAAAPTTPDAFDLCANEPKPAERLACFDKQILARRAMPKTITDVHSDVGLDARQVRQKHPEQAAEQAAFNIDSVVVKVTEHRPLISTFELANGQVWEQTETITGRYIRPQEKVTIRKGAMGGFLLISAGGVSVRVHRMK